MTYIPLHVHSVNSPYSGMLTVDEIVSRASFLRFPAIALTDKWTTYGHHEFYHKALAAGIKPVLGIEARHISITGGKGTYHLTLLAENQTGYKNITALTGKHHENGKDEYVTEQDLVLHREGIIALTGCLKGEASQAVLHGNLPRMRAVVEKLIKIYGRDNVYLEIMNHNIDREQFVTEQLQILSKKLKVPMVATNDDKFALKEESEYYGVLRSISGESEERAAEILAEYHLKKKSELEPFFYVVPGVLEESGRIAERCEVELETSSRIRFVDDRTPRDTLRERCKRRFLLAYHSKRKKEIAPLEIQMDTELRCAGEEGMSEFLLFLAKLFGGCAKRGIRLKIMGGEILDSLLAYLLGIVPLDPVRYGLVFESFNTRRKGVPPQMELIKARGVRETFMLVLRSLLPRCGIFHQVVREGMSFSTLAREISGAAEISTESRDTLLAVLGSIRKKETLHDMLDVSDQLTHMYNEDRRIRKILHSAAALKGKVFHFNHNTSRLVILPDDRNDLVSCVRGADGERFCLVDGKTIERLGGWILLLQTSHFLTALDGTSGSTMKSAGERGDHENDDRDGFERLDDKRTYELISSGNTTGVYLLESRGVRELLEKIRPASFEELVNVISLYRPGPLEGKLWQRYIENAEKKGKVFLPHHTLAPALESTRGLLLYRQQVREILIDAAGISGEKAVRIENAVYNRDTGDMLKARLDFIRGAMEKEINEEDAQKIFDFLLHNAGFTYDKAFSCAQGYISYRTAFLKTHRHDEYFASLLNSTDDIRDRQRNYLDYLKSVNKEVFPSDINSSWRDFTLEPGGIRSPLNESGTLDKDELEVIVKEREESGTFTSLADFMERTSTVLPMSSVHSVVDAGLFDFLMRTHSEMKDEALAFYEKHARAGEFFKQKPHHSRDGSEGAGSQLSFFDQDFESE